MHIILQYKTMGENNIDLPEDFGENNAINDYSHITVSLNPDKHRMLKLQFQCVNSSFLSALCRCADTYCSKAHAQVCQYIFVSSVQLQVHHLIFERSIQYDIK